MSEQYNDLYNQLDNLLSNGFTSQDQYEGYLELKRSYETETGDLDFSIRELAGQLEVIMTNREYFFPNLDETVRIEYLDLVQRLEAFSSSKAAYYRRCLVQY